MKKSYVVFVRIAAKVAGSIGLLAWLEKSDNRILVWLRSLFSIYDSTDLIHLDLPWWTFDAIEAVQLYISKHNSDVRVFEYGSGASTVWLAKRCTDVATVEHDLGFAQSMRPIFAEHRNITMAMITPEKLRNDTNALSQRKGYKSLGFDNYVNAINEVPGTFDIIVVDGRARTACLKKARERLSERGIIVFDNSNRQEYREAILNSGLNEQILRGLAPALPYFSQTSILSRRA